MNMVVKCFSYLLISDDRYNQDGHVHFAKDHGKARPQRCYTLSDGKNMEGCHSTKKNASVN